jgi:thiamine-monophosphate kinase
VPLSAAARAVLVRDPALIETVLTGGDDYEIVAAVPARKVEALRRAAAAAGVPVREIGKVVAGQGEACFLGSDGKRLALAHPSFSHF